MAYSKTMIKFNKEQWEILQAGKIILNRHALLPRKIDPLTDEQFIMDCILFQSQELIKRFQEAQEQQNGPVSNNKSRLSTNASTEGVANDPSDAAQTVETNTAGAPAGSDTISSEAGLSLQAVSDGTAEESE